MPLDLGTAAHYYMIAPSAEVCFPRWFLQWFFKSYDRILLFWILTFRLFSYSCNRHSCPFCTAENPYHYHAFPIVHTSPENCPCLISVCPNFRSMFARATIGPPGTLLCGFLLIFRIYFRNVGISIIFYLLNGNAEGYVALMGYSDAAHRDMRMLTNSYILKYGEENVNWYNKRSFDYGGSFGTCNWSGEGPPENFEQDYILEASIVISVPLHHVHGP